MSKQLLAGYCIAVGCIWLIVAHRAEPQVMLGIVLGAMLLWLFKRKEG